MIRAVRCRSRASNYVGSPCTLSVGRVSTRYRLAGVMTKKTQLLIVLIVLCVVDAVIPFLPALGLVLIYVVLEKPAWFPEMVREVYSAR